MHNKIFFIVGVPRSGTTLLSVLLNNHSEVFIDKDAIAKRILFLKNRLRINYLNQSLFSSKQDFWKSEIIKDERLQDFLDVNNIHQYENIGNFLRDSLVKRAQLNGKLFFGDKSPDAIEDIEGLLVLFPNAKIIQVIRDSRSNILSLVKRQYMNIKRAAVLWREWNIVGLSYKNILTNEQLYTLKYEDLVLNTPESLREVCHFLDITYESDMENLMHSEATQNENAYVKQKIDSSKVMGWKQEISKNNLLAIESITGELMVSLGYELVNKDFKSKHFSYLEEYLALMQEQFKLLFIKRRQLMKSRNVKEIKVPVSSRMKSLLKILIVGMFNAKWFSKYKRSINR